MAKETPLYLKLANRFAHLALGAKAQDDDEEDEDKKKKDPDAAANKDEKKDDAQDGKKSRGAKAARAEDDEDDEDEEADDEADDEDEDEKKKGERKAAASARASERARWAAVMSSSEAKGRVALACSLLADTGMSADKIRAALLASPAEARSGLSARMEAVPRPDIGSAPSAKPATNSPTAQAEAIVAAYNKAVGAR
jgi:hypothetical protein